MSKRHADALAIQQGACNPSGIAYSIVEACAEARAEGKNTQQDAAIRLMVHQLAYICHVPQIDAGLDEHRKLMEECGKTPEGEKFLSSIRR